MFGPKSKTAAWIKDHVRHAGEECLPWPFGHDSLGYGRAKVRGYTTRLAHRIMCQMAHGDPPQDNSVARHTCGNGHEGCVNPNHLRWGTAQDNSDDCRRHGRLPLGEKSSNVVLTEASVRKIRQEYSKGLLSQRALAAEFGVTHGTVWAILIGKTWGHVE